MEKTAADIRFHLLTVAPGRVAPVWNLGRSDQRCSFHGI
jgi:hypothetical protein